MSRRYEMAEILAIPILDVGRDLYGLTPVQARNNYGGFQEHSSLMVKLDNNTFFYNRDAVAGTKNKSNETGSVINFVMWAEKTDDKKAAIEILVKYAEGNHIPLKEILQQPPKKKERKKFIAPKENKDDDSSFRYLCKERKIMVSVYHYLKRHKYLYEEKGYNKNIVFCSYNPETGVMDFAQRCSSLSTIAPERRKRDVSGSLYYQCWFIDNNSTKLIVTEAPIDTASFMSLMVRFGKKYSKYNHQALTGSNKIKATADVLDTNPHITKVYVAVDNDDAGDHAWQWLLNWKQDTHWPGSLVRMSPTNVKDINDILKNNVDDTELFKKIKKM